MLRIFFYFFFAVPWNNFSPDRSFLIKKKYRIQNKTWKIGQWFPITPETLLGAEGKLDTDHLKYFSIGREAIAHILQHTNLSKKVALLPNYTCVTVIYPFIQEGFTVHFYRYNEDLTINAEVFLDIFQKTEPSICIFQPLSGMGFLKSESSLIEYAHDAGCVTIVDQTQDIYNSMDNPHVDYYCASIRKWYPFPDGAYLYSKKHIIDGCDNLKDNFIYQTSMGLYMLTGHLITTYDNPFFTTLHNFSLAFRNNYVGSSTIRAHSMSDYSRRVLMQQDEDSNCKRRIENFTYLYQRIKGLQSVRPAFVDIKRLTSVPLSFPVYAENRDKFASFLFANSVLTQILWSRPKYVDMYGRLDKTTEYIYDHILFLPCDQRYGLDDMKRMADIIRNYDQKQQ